MSGAEHGPDEQELKRALRAALGAPVGEVDWERLHGAIMAEAVTRAGAPAGGASDRISAWSARGIPAAAVALAAALVALLLLPLERRAPASPPPGFLPVGEELVDNLPPQTRQLLSAGFDVEILLRAMLENDERERDRT